MLPFLVTLALAAPPDDPFAVEARVATLPGGLRVVASPLHRTDKVALHLHIGVGARDEGPGEQGLAHLFEHLMFEGSVHAPGNAYDTWLTAAGGENNAFTTHDETAFHAVAPSGALDLMLFLESDRLAWLRPALTDEALANQVDVVRRERAQDHAAPHGRDYAALYRLAYPEGHPYRTPVIGTVADVEGTTVAAARAFHRDFYDTRTAVLGIVGHVDPEHAIARARHWFADVPPAAEPRLRATGAALPHRTAPVTGHLVDHVDGTTVYRARRGVPIEHPDEAALVVASYLLSDGRGTRLDRLAFRKERVSDTDARLRAGELDGLFIVGATHDRPRVAWLTRRLDRALGSLVRRPPSEAELRRAKERIRRLLLDGLETPASRAEILVDCVRLVDDPDCTRRDWERVRAVTADDVRDAVGRVLERPVITLVVVPPGTEEAVPDGSTLVELP